MEVILVPIVLVVFGLWAEGRMAERQEDLAVTQMVDTYFDGIASHLASENPIESYSVIIARTRALLSRLQNRDRKHEIINIVRFLSETAPDVPRGSVFEQDPQADHYHISLSNLDLSDTEIKTFAIEDVIWRGSTFEGSEFYNFSCEQCDFSETSLRNVVFQEVSFAGSDLTSADLRGSNIEDVFLLDTLLSNAKWSNGKICAKESIGVCK